MTARRGAVLLAIAFALAGACKIEGKRQAHADVGADSAALRAAFNAEAGKVRLVVLVSPT